MLLATAYSVAAMGFVYPIARGSAPVLVLVAGAVVAGARVSLLAATGRASGGGGHRAGARRASRSGRPRDLALALSVGVCIAGYTLVDKHGIVHAAPIAYLEVVFGLTAIVYVLGGLARPRRPPPCAPRSAGRPVLAGVGFFGAYALTLAALRLAPAASVAAVRESSVVMAAAVLGDQRARGDRAERFAGAVAVVAGIALISLG